MSTPLIAWMPWKDCAPPLLSGSNIVVLYDDGCTVSCYSCLDSVGWVDAEDGEPYTMEGAWKWAYLPHDFVPYFMERTFD